MEALFASGHAADIVIAVLALEPRGLKPVGGASVRLSDCSAPRR